MPCVSYFHVSEAHTNLAVQQHRDRPVRIRHSRTDVPRTYTESLMPAYGEVWALKIPRRGHEDDCSTIAACGSHSEYFVMTMLAKKTTTPLPHVFGLSRRPHPCDCSK